MANDVESTYDSIADLNPSWPAAGDSISLADDHIRVIKLAVQNTFPSVTGAVTASHTELNIMDGVTATTDEINILAGATLSTAELNYVDGVTANVQVQLNQKMPSSATPTEKTDSFTAVAGNWYLLTAGASKTITMPASASAYDYIFITNGSGNDWAVDRNGLKIMNGTSNDTLNTDKHYEYVYSGATVGWVRMKSS